MEGDSTIIFAVFYGGTWTKQDDGRWQYQNYESKVTDVPKNCTFEQLKDEVYDIVNVDRDRYCLSMKFQYVLSYQPCKPQEIRRDKDVKIFLRQVTDVVPVTPLYVDVLPTDPANEDKSYDCNSGNGSNHCSSSCPPTQVRGRVRMEEKMYRSNVAVSPIRENNEFQSPIRENNEFERPIQKSQLVLENQVPEIQVLENQVSEIQIPIKKLPQSKKSSSHHSATTPLCEGDSLPHTSTTSLQSGSSSYMDIESDSSDCDEFYVGQVYDDKKGLKQKLYLHAVTHNYQIKVVRSSTTRYEVRCFDDNCEFKLRANKIPHSDKLFIMRKYFGEHACLQYSHATNGNHRQATSRILGDAIKETYDGIARVNKPKEIQFNIKLKYGVDISYDKAWRVREHALNSIRGTVEESFTRLPSYFSMLEATNPGTVTRIAIDDGQHFKYCFMALGASVRGFQSNIRPVVAIDGTILKYRYRGYLYVAAAVDGNGQIFPLAFGVGDSENEDAYTWFFRCFREAYGEPNNLVFISDRHKAIENALKEVYPNCYHGLCLYHISQNLKAKKFGHEDQILPVFHLAANVYLPNMFEHYMNELRNINIRVVEYLSELEVERWARYKFPVVRYNIVTINIVECMNDILKDARERPLVPLLETIREKLQQWFHVRRIAAGNMTTTLTTWTEEQLKKREKVAQRTFVTAINPIEYRVVSGGIEGMVNLSTKSCTCRRFDMDQYPCVHGIAACLHQHIEFHKLCSHYYHVDTLCASYAYSIYPVGDIIQWEIPPEVQKMVVRPPDVRRCAVGRPRKNRMLSQGEEKMKYKCGRCGNLGHNRARCIESMSRPDVGSSRGGI